MASAARQPEALTVTITAQVGDASYALGSAAVTSADEAMAQLPVLLQDIAIALIAAAS